MEEASNEKRWDRLLKISRVLLLIAFFFCMIDALFQVFLYPSLILFFIYYFGSGKNREFKLQKNDLFLILFFAALIISAGLSVQKGEAFGGTAVFLIYSLVLFYFRLVKFDEKGYRAVIRSASLSLFVWCGFALVHYFIIRETITIRFFQWELIHFDYSNIHQASRPLNSFFVMPSRGGNLIAVVSVIILAFLIRQWKKLGLQDRLGMSAALMIGTFTLIMTYTRGAFILLSVSLLVIILLTKKWKLMIGVALILMGVLFAPIEKFRTTLANPFHSPNAPGRVLQYKAGLKYFLGLKLLSTQNPVFGIGLLNFPRVFKEKYSQSPDFEDVPFIHNNYIAFLLETGIAGFILFYLFLFLTVYRMIKSRDDRWRLPQVTAVAFICGFMVNSLFDALLYTVPIGIYLWVVLGLLQNQSLNELAE